jgi:hypothetical protein
MATLVEGGADIMDALGGGLPSQQTREWLTEQSQAVSATLSQYSQQFFDQSREMFQTINDSQAMQMLRNVKSRVKDAFTPDLISIGRTLEQLQTAGPNMQRWIMAEPTLRERYLNNTADGYGDTYKNFYGAVAGENHYDYRRVMDGVGHLDEEDVYVRKHYRDILHEGEEELSTYNKLDIRDTWAMVKHHVERGEEDPSSVYGNPL